MNISGKGKLILIGIALLTIACAAIAGWAATGREASAAAKGIICIDAGHGGFDPGAVGTQTEVGEDVINLAVAQELKAEFEARGFRVLMTRSDENALAGTKAEDMQRRREIIQASNATLMISIHMNANGDASVSGPIAYFYPGSADGELLAQCVQDKLNEQLKPSRDKIINSDNYFVLRAGEMPSIIVEVGFMTNDHDEYLLQQPDYQAKAAAAIAEGAEEYLRRTEAGAPKGL